MSAGASIIFFLDHKGKTIIRRDFRGDAGHGLTEKFQKKVLDVEEVNLTPVFTESGHTFVWIKHNNIFIVAVCKGNPNVMMILAFLFKLRDVLAEYFGGLEDESIRDNFVITYELLDEMMDNGYPQITEEKILQQYIKTESFKLKKKDKITEVAVPATATTAVSWRHEGIRYPKNEVFLDVVEKLNLLAASNGTVLSTEINGIVRMNCLLTGMPELKLGLNDKVLFEMSGRTTRGKLIDMEDIKFHQCVRLARFEQDRTISFIPPDQKFELMSYRLNSHVKPLIWVEVNIENYTSSKIEFIVKTKTQFKSRSYANNVEIAIPVPNDANSPYFKTNTGIVKYVPDQEAMVWFIKSFPGQREYLMKARFGLPSVMDPTRDKFKKAPINIKFEIPYFTVSGIQVRYLKIQERSGYHALPWVRYITQNGLYNIRMGAK